MVETTGSYSVGAEGTGIGGDADNGSGDGGSVAVGRIEPVNTVAGDEMLTMGMEGAWIRGLERAEWERNFWKGRARNE